MNTTAPTGRLKVTVATADPYTVDTPISVIHGETLQLVETSKCNEEISLPVGTYVVSTTLPRANARSASRRSSRTSSRSRARGRAAAGGGARTGEPVVAPSAAPERPVTRSAALTAPWHVRFHVRTQEGAYEARGHAGLGRVTYA